MAGCLTQYSIRQLKSSVFWLYTSFGRSSMNRKLFLLLLFMGIFMACLVTLLPKFIYFTDFSNCRFISSDTESYRQPEADTSSVILRVRQKLPINSDVKKEAVAALNVARNLQDQGKTEKARKIFQHALSLDPWHADILTAYGEFLELYMNDIVLADHYYKIALEVSPSHSKALVNRQRTSTVVEEMDQKRLNRIDQKRALLYTVPANHPALRRANKEAYFAYIYHSNAMEGNTLTLSQTRAIVETRTAVGGRSLVEQNEVLGLDAALSYMNSTLLGRVGHLNLQDVLNLHRRVLGYVDPPEAGRFRNAQVYVGEFIPAAPVDVPVLMDEFFMWINSNEALDMHPIEFAAGAHHQLVFIHPFYDGNGRTSRLLMNVILMQAGYPPVSILVEDRLRYYETLEMANSGDLRPFIRFVAESTERTLDDYLAATMEDPGHSLQQTSDLQNSTKQQRIVFLDN